MDQDSDQLDELETSVHYDDNKSVTLGIKSQIERSNTHDTHDLSAEAATDAPSLNSKQSRTKTNRSLQSLFSESSPSQHVSFYSANDNDSSSGQGLRMTPSTKSDNDGRNLPPGILIRSSPNITPLHIQPLAHSTPFNQPSPHSNYVSPDPVSPHSAFSSATSSHRGIMRSPAARNLNQSSPVTPNPPVTSTSQIPTTMVTTTTTVPLKKATASPQVTFATLPAKAPLTTKKSLGKRMSDLSSAKSSMSHKSSDFDADRTEITSRSSDMQNSQIELSAAHAKQQTPKNYATSHTDNASDDAPRTILSKQPQQSGMTPGSAFYNRIHNYSDDAHEPDEEDEEDWIPLSKATPAPRSRFLNSAAFKNMPLPEKEQAKSTDIVMEEDEEEAPAITKKETSIPEADTAQEITQPIQETDHSIRSINAAKDAPRYLASTASSRLKSSPAKSAVAMPPPSPALSMRQQPAGSPAQRLPMSFSTRPQTSPVRHQSPLRHTISRPASPERKSSDKDAVAGKVVLSPRRAQKPSIRLQMSPARGNLARSGSQLAINQASSIAVAAAAQVNGHSPVTSALRNMKTSTADVFRRAKLLLFDNDSNSKKEDGSSSGKELVKSSASTLSPTKKTLAAESSDQRMKETRIMYPDISALLVDNGGSPGRLNARPLGHIDASSFNHTHTSNPAKALFQAPNALRTAARFEQTSTQVSTNGVSATSAQRNSIEDGPDSGDLHLSPEAQHHLRPNGIAMGTVAAAAAAINAATASADSTGAGLREKQQQAKRVKSMVRKPAARTKQAPVVVRVPMGAQRELEQQRKFAQNVSTASAGATDNAAAEKKIPVANNNGCEEEQKKTVDKKQDSDRRRQENARRAAMQQQQTEEKKKAEDEEQARRKFALANRNSRVPQTRAVANLVVSRLYVLFSIDRN